LLPIRQFGIYAAIGVAASLLWLLYFLPAGCAFWPLRSTGRDEPLAPGAGAGVNWWYWGERVTGRSGLVTAAALATAAICGWGLCHVKTSVTAEEFFSRDAVYPRNSRWLEERLGGMVPMELVIRVGPTSRLGMLEQME